MDQLKESHYFHLPSQGNIYTMADLQMADGSSKLLVASLKRDIFLLEYQESLGGLIPKAKEVSFTYIPSGAEIISLDAFNKSLTKNDFVIGITIIKNSNNLDSLEFYLNIYSEWEESEDFNIENVAQNCLNVELNFTPYQLLHTDLIKWDNNQIISKEVVFLLSGSDNQIHVYREYSADHLYKEVDNKEFFPELIKTPSPVVWLDVHLNDDFSERLCILGCECGYVRLTKVCLRTNRLICNFSTKFNNYISQVRIYKEQNDYIEKFEAKGDKTTAKTIVPTFKKSDDIFNVLIVNTILPPILFSHVLKFGFSNYSSLPRENWTNILTCSQIADLNFDGKKEILIGNSAKEIMLYKYDKECGWCLEEIKMFCSPIIGMKYIDIFDDGVKELVVLSMKGIHFLQHDFSFVRDTLIEKVERLSIPDISALEI